MYIYVLEHVYAYIHAYPYSLDPEGGDRGPRHDRGHSGPPGTWPGRAPGSSPQSVILLMDKILHYSL